VLKLRLCLSARLTAATKNLGILSNEYCGGNRPLKIFLFLHQRCFLIPAQGFLPWVTVRQELPTPKEFTKISRTPSEFPSFSIDYVPRVGNPGLQFENTFGVEEVRFCIIKVLVNSVHPKLSKNRSDRKTETRLGLRLSAALTAATKCEVLKSVDDEKILGLHTGEAGVASIA
jgi:hypothetical protein